MRHFGASLGFLLILWVGLSLTAAMVLIWRGGIVRLSPMDHRAVESHHERLVRILRTQPLSFRLGLG